MALRLSRMLLKKLDETPDIYKLWSRKVLADPPKALNPSKICASGRSSGIKSVILPFGKFKGRSIVEADEQYLLWIQRSQYNLQWGARARRALAFKRKLAGDGDMDSASDDDDDDDDIVTLLKSCSSVERARGLHAHLEAGLTLPGATRTFFLNMLMETYGNCGSVKDAVALFDSMGEQRNVASWKTIVKVCVENGCIQEAGRIFEVMPDDVVAQKELIIPCTMLVAAYSAAGSPLLAKKAFDRISASGDVGAWNVMMTCYAKHGFLQEARATFYSMPCRNVMCWNGFVSALHNHGMDNEAKAIQSLQPAWDHISLDLKFSLLATDADKAKAAFDGMPVRGIVTWTNLMRCYARGEMLSEARASFLKMPMHNLVSVTVAIGCSYDAEEAKVWFDSMQEHSLVSWTSLLASCALVHRHPDSANIFSKMPKHDVISSTTALFWYTRLGHMEKALPLFNAMGQQDGLSWMAILAGFCESGKVNEAVGLHQVMLLEGVSSTKICFSYLLAAHSHVGAVEQGRCCFLSMQADHGIQPEIEHYCCIVSLLGRAGHLENATELVHSMPFTPNDATLRALLGACKTHKDVNRAQGIVLSYPMEVDSYVTYKILVGVIAPED